MWKCKVLESAKIYLEVAQLLKYRKKYILWLANKDFGRGYNLLKDWNSEQAFILWHEFEVKVVLLDYSKIESK